MTNQLEFMDCPNCGKRMVTTAPLCRHCGKASAKRDRQRIDVAKEDVVKEDVVTEEECDNAEFDHDYADSHMAAPGGGYDREADAFSYNEFIEVEFGSRNFRPRVKLWIWITAWVLIVLFCLPFVAPLLLQIWG